MKREWGKFEVGDIVRPHRARIDRRVVAIDPPGRYQHVHLERVDTGERESWLLSWVRRVSA